MLWQELTLMKCKHHCKHHYKDCKLAASVFKNNKTSKSDFSQFEQIQGFVLWIFHVKFKLLAAKCN